MRIQIATHQPRRLPAIVQHTPVWMAMSNTWALASSKPSNDPARIKWPVEEIGRNSVSPSTTPMMAALTSKTMSTRSPLLTK